MGECELTAGCIFFNDKMADMPSMASMMKSVYCKSDPDKCARYKVVKAVGREKVPADLFPNQVEKADAVINKG
jgi:hypothetical protein